MSEAAPRCIRPALTAKEAQLIIWRLESETKAIFIECGREGRKPTRDEKGNIRRYRRIREQLEAELDREGVEVKHRLRDADREREAALAATSG